MVMKQTVNPERIKKWVDLWSQRRANGCASYIFCHAVPKVGVLCSFLVTLLHLELTVKFHGNTNPWRWLIELLVLVFVFGIGFGFLFWHLNEKEYQKWLKDNSHCP